MAQSTRWLRAVRLGVALALGTLFLVAWMWGLREAASVHAGPATLYVDWATGSDTTDCTSYAGPCATIGYALGQAGDGDIILVATGTYTPRTLFYTPGRFPVHRPDLDWDQDVDVTDITIVAGVWRAEQDESQYRQYYDLYHDGQINVVDIMRVASRWGEMFDLGPHFPLGYSPYRPGQAPGGPTPSPLEIGEDMEIIERETRLIRTYGACDEELSIIPDIANNHGIHVYQGAELTSTLSLNDQETGEPWGVWCNEAQAKPRCQGWPLLGEAVVSRWPGTDYRWHVEHA